MVERQRASEPERVALRQQRAGAPVRPVGIPLTALGNAAVSRLLQPKLAAGSPGDAHEREADRAADALTGSSTDLPSLTARGDGGAGLHAAAGDAVADVLTSGGTPLDQATQARFGP